MLNYTENKGIEIIYFLAEGLIKLQKKMENGGTCYPYPDELRIGLDKLAAEGLEKNIDYPKNISEAISFFNKPINSWGLIEIEAFKDNEALMEDGQLTDTCLDFSLENKDIETELTEKLILDVMNICKTEGKPEDYVKFRRKIAENKLMNVNDIMRWSINKSSCCAANLFRKAYEPIPKACVHNDKVYICSNCGWTIEWRNNIPKCDNPLCREYTDNYKKIQEIEGSINDIWRLKRGTHRFIAKPAIHELALEKKLLKIGLEVELWPDYDAYDLKIVFPDGEIWAVDVKDWANPYLLAKSVDVFSEEPFWDKAFYVVPQYRKKHCRDYKTIFKNNFSNEQNVDMDMENDFIKRVKNKLW